MVLAADCGGNTRAYELGGHDMRVSHIIRVIVLPLGVGGDNVEHGQGRGK